MLGRWAVLPEDSADARCTALVLHHGAFMPDDTSPCNWSETRRVSNRRPRRSPGYYFSCSPSQISRELSPARAPPGLDVLQILREYNSRLRGTLHCMVVSGATLCSHSPAQMSLRNSAGRPNSLSASARCTRISGLGKNRNHTVSPVLWTARSSTVTGVRNVLTSDGLNGHAHRSPRKSSLPRRPDHGR